MKENETKTEQQKKPSKGVKVLKNVLNTIINILIVLVLITSLLIAVMALTSRADGLSTIFGFTFQPIQSDSMKGGSPDGYEGGDFESGDLMIAKSTNFDSEYIYELGDIVTFRLRDADGNDVLIVHRIVNVIQDEFGTYRYQTWGDNREMSETPDQKDTSDYLYASEIASVYYSTDYRGTIIKGFGKVLDYLKSQQGFFFVVLLPMIIFFMYELIRVILNATDYKKSKAEDEKKEAVDAAVAAALAAKEAEKQDEKSAEALGKKSTDVPSAPAEMTPEQLEQFKQFMEFQKMQNAAKEAEAPKDET